VWSALSAGSVNGESIEVGHETQGIAVGAEAVGSKGVDGDEKEEQRGAATASCEQAAAQESDQEASTSRDRRAHPWITPDRG
jgi:hypothetical protein